ncbi:MAG: hypothetical protein JNM39_04225 [Bdellovibrionaceae bacterium]|nr:hypothetical protein [Pseudobdellovibrionaceae bacterium]
MKEIKWAAAFFATWSMSITPLAEAKEVEKQNLKQVRAMIQSLGYSGPNRAKNMGEIWARAKLNMPPELIAELDGPARLFSQDPIPQVRVESVEGGGQADAVKLVMSSGKETITIELLNGPDHVAKINGILFSAEDLMGEVDSKDKIFSIPYFRTAVLKKKEEIRNGSILPTPEQFAAMNAVDRVHYRRHLAGLLVAVEAVQNSKTPKTASHKETGNRYDVLISLFVGEDASAGPRGMATPVGPGTAAGGCVVVGFASTYEYDKKTKGKYCSLEKIEANLPKNDPSAVRLYNQHKNACTGGKVACNSQFFVNSDGGPVCVNAGRGAKLRDATKSCFDTRANRVDTIRGLLIQDGKNADELWTEDGKAKGKDSVEKILDTLTPIIALIDGTIANCKAEKGEPGQKTACEALEARRGQLAEQIAVLEIERKSAAPTAQPTVDQSTLTPKGLDGKIRENCLKELEVAKATNTEVTCDERGTIRNPDGTAYNKPKGSEQTGKKLSSSGDKGLCEGDTATKICSWVKWGGITALVVGGIYGIGKVVKNWWERSQKKEAKKQNYTNPVSSPAPACPAGTSCSGSSTPTVAPSPISPVETPATKTPAKATVPLTR